MSVVETYRELREARRYAIHLLGTLNPKVKPDPYLPTLLSQIDHEIANVTEGK